MPRDLPDELLRTLDPASVRWYAVGSGWKPVEVHNSRAILLNHPSDGLKQILLPTQADASDNLGLLYEAVRALAEQENRSVWEMFKDLLLPAGDALRLSVSSPAAAAGTLPLDNGAELLRSGRDMLLAAACSAHHAQAYYPRQSFTSAQEFLRRCRLGQTELGSYVLTILAPVPPPEIRSLFPEPAEDTVETAPYERRVTLILMRALGALRAVLERGKFEQVTAHITDGVSANLCEALGRLSLPDGPASLSIQMRWSRNRPHVAAPDRVRFDTSDFPYIRAAGRLLGEQVEPRREHVEGRVINLHAEPASLFEPFRGQVTIRTLLGDRPARVRFQLDEEDYVRACDAHRNRRTVAVTGLLHRDAEAKLFEFRQVHGFQVLPEPAGVPESQE